MEKTFLKRKMQIRIKLIMFFKKEINIFFLKEKNFKIKEKLKIVEENIIIIKFDSNRKKNELRVF